MKKAIGSILTVTILFSCQREQNTATQPADETAPGITVLTEAKPEWQHEKLRLLPIVADAAFLDANQATASLASLPEALQDYKFRITEKQRFGRYDQGDVNTLTVQNKTDRAVFLMSGEVVQGGKQDRIIAEDQVIAARSIIDIPVFCVEQGRWMYRDEAEPTSVAEVQQKKVFAFTGYYHVASNDIRRTVKETKNQEAIWQKVGEVTAVHHAESGTSAYASLETADEFTKQRDEYLRFFEEKFNALDNVIGVVAVSGHQVLGADLFGSPALFERQYHALLHSYATDALTNGRPIAVSDETIQRFIKDLETKLGERAAGSFEYEGQLVHFTGF